MTSHARPKSAADILFDRAIAAQTEGQAAHAENSTTGPLMKTRRTRKQAISSARSR
jgi:hypothetical protein